MKKIYTILCFFLLFVVGCSANDQTNEGGYTFSLPMEKQQSYQNDISTTLNGFYWRYDSESISFFEEVLPDKKSGSEVYSASQEVGYNLASNSGDTAVVATLDLLHFNGEKAGIAYFYFVKDKLVGVHYAAKDTNKIYSLSTRNVYRRSVDFDSFEIAEDNGNYSKTTTIFNANGFTSIVNVAGGSKMLAVDEEFIDVYAYNKGMRSDRRLTFEDGLGPISATFYDGEKIAVLLGSNIYSQGEEGHEINGKISEKVVFYDENYSIIGEMPLAGSGYSCVSFVEGQLALFSDNVMEFYKLGSEETQPVSQIFINHRVTAIKVDDLDGNGVLEYIMTDGMDLYLYHKTKLSFVCLWETNIGVESLTGNIYTGDLNKDGIKEIYICDNTGTVIRYVLTQTGLVSRNEDIVYGQKIFAGDFNNDGVDDYINYTMGDTNQIIDLYIGN